MFKIVECSFFGRKYQIGIAADIIVEMADQIENRTFIETRFSATNLLFYHQIFHLLFYQQMFVSTFFI
jgi:hypothetical protein